MVKVFHVIVMTKLKLFQSIWFQSLSINSSKDAHVEDVKHTCDFSYLGILELCLHVFVFFSCFHTFGVDLCAFFLPQRMQTIITDED